MSSPIPPGAGNVYAAATHDGATEPAQSGPIEPSAVQIGNDVLVRLRDGRLVLVQANPGSSPPATGDNLPATTSGSDHAPVAASGGTPATFGGLIGGIINFISLALAFTALAAAALMLKEQLHLLKARMERDAAFATKVGELCGDADVDAYFVALFTEASQAFTRVAEASGLLADAADQMETHARGVKDAHDTQYRGVYEVRQASPYDQPKPGFNEVQ